MSRKNLNLGFAIIFIALIAGHVAIGQWIARSHIQIRLAKAPTPQPQWQHYSGFQPQIINTQAGLQDSQPNTQPSVPPFITREGFPWFGSTAPPASNTGDMRYAVFLPDLDSFRVQRHPYEIAPRSPLDLQDLKITTYLYDSTNRSLIGPPAPGLQTGTSPFLPPAEHLVPQPPLDLPLSPNDAGPK